VYIICLCRVLIKDLKTGADEWCRYVPDVPYWSNFPLSCKIRPVAVHFESCQLQEAGTAPKHIGGLGQDI